MLSHGNQAEIYSNTLSRILKPWAKLKTGRIFEVDPILKCPRNLLSLGPYFTLVIKSPLEFICHSLIGDRLMGFTFTQTKLGW